MKRILVVSSYVARGTVGLQATLPALSVPGVEVFALPTVVLSNHPGHKACAGTAIEPETLSNMVKALMVNGWLTGLDAVFVGYLPSPDHAAWAADMIWRIKAETPAATVILDPVLGDDPKGLYVRSETATAIREVLVPLADVLTPNRFELSWLTGRPVVDRTTAVAAARTLQRPLVAVTSVPDGESLLENVAVGADSVDQHSNELKAQAPHGTGDYFAGRLTCGLLQGLREAEALRVASLDVARTLALSTGHDYLKFANLSAQHAARA